MALTKKYSPENISNNLYSVPTEEITMNISAEHAHSIIARLTDLYTNPIEATVREIISNGVDAHVKAHNESPLEVKIPSALSPVFVVKDYGVGMSPSDIQHIYSQYGASTKMDDFSQIGAYGLGAKAPLSYCNKFTVSTVQDGVKTTFTVSREESKNVVKIIGQAPTEDANGTEVSIPVMDKDTQSFASEVMKMKRYDFQNLLQVSGNSKSHRNNYPFRQDSDREKKFYFFTDLVLDEASGTTGKMWIGGARLQDALDTVAGGGRHYNQEKSITGILQGYPYILRSQYYDNDAILIELKPGVVDFSSSRDNVTENHRKQAVVDKVDAILKDKDLVRAFIFRMLEEFGLQAMLRTGKMRFTDKGKALLQLNDTFDLTDYEVMPDLTLGKLLKLDEPRKNVAVFSQMNLKQDGSRTISRVVENKIVADSVNGNNDFLTSDVFTRTSKEVTAYLKNNLVGDERIPNRGTLMLNALSSLANPLVVAVEKVSAEDQVRIFNVRKHIVQKLINGKAQLPHNGYVSAEFVFFNGEIPPAIKNLLEKDENSKVITVEEAFELAKNERTEKQAREAIDHSTFMATEWRPNQWSSAKDVKVDDFIANKNYYLVLSRDNYSVSFVLNQLYSEDVLAPEDVEEGRIKILALNGAKITSKQLTALAPTGRIFAAADWRNNSLAGQELMQNKKHLVNYIPTVKNIPANGFISLVIQNTLNDLADDFIKLWNTDELQLPLASEISKKYLTDKDRYQRRLSQQEIVKALGANEQLVTLANSLNNFFNRERSTANFLDNISVSTRYILATDIEKNLVNVLLNVLVENAPRLGDSK